MRKLLSHCAEHAQRSISLTTAYFIPSRRMIQTLARAEKRGVQVKLLVPGKSDVPAASFAGRAFFGKLLEAGVEIYTYRGEMLHAKTYVFDCCWSIIGSTNLDYQSLLYNDEGNVGIFDAAFGLEMTEVFHRDLNQSIRIEKESWEKRPLLEKLKESFFALLRRGSSSLFTHSEGREEGPIFQVSQGDRSG
jgi:cardiolipin synthase